MRKLVYELRNSGFNTVWACGHLPKPYVTVVTYRHNEERMLRDFLDGGGYQSFKVEWKYYGAVCTKLLAVTFHGLPGEGGELVDEKWLKSPLILSVGLDV